MVENLPTNAGDMVSVPGPGRPQLHGATKGHVTQLLSCNLERLGPCAAAAKARVPQEQPPQ